MCPRARFQSLVLSCPVSIRPIPPIAIGRFSQRRCSSELPGRAMRYNALHAKHLPRLVFAQLDASALGEPARSRWTQAPRCVPIARPGRGHRTAVTSANAGSQSRWCAKGVRSVPRPANPLSLHFAPGFPRDPRQLTRIVRARDNREIARSTPRSRTAVRPPPRRCVGKERGTRSDRTYLAGSLTGRASQTVGKFDDMLGPPSCARKALVVQYAFHVFRSPNG